MITVSTMSGAWSVANVYQIGGSAYGLHYGNFAWIVALPNGGSSVSTTLKGSLIQSGLNSLGDRDCIHLDGHGTVISHGGKFSSEIVDCSSPSQVGPHTFLTKYSIRTGYRSWLDATGVLTLGLKPFTINIPDHSTSSGIAFRNIIMRGEVHGDTIALTTQYESRSSPHHLWVKEETSSGSIIIDKENRRWRGSESTSWKSFNDVYNKSIVKPYSPPSFSTSNWLAIIRQVKEYYHTPTDKYVFGDLCRRCANDAQVFDINNIETLSELPFIVHELKNTFQLLKGKKTLKTASRLYLSWKYGVRLTVSDVLEMVGAVPRYLHSTSKQYRWTRARESVTSTAIGSIGSVRRDIYHYKVYYDPIDTKLMSLVNQLWSVGLFPSLQNSWDLIPYSFVVDWFADVSEKLDAYDAATYWSTVRVLGALSSTKTIYEGLPASEVLPGLRDCSGIISVSEYRRFRSDALVTPTFFSDTPREFKNYAEATALLISRSRLK